MGFTEERVRRALLMSHNDLNNATNFLLQESLWWATVDYQCATDLNQRHVYKEYSLEIMQLFCSGRLKISKSDIYKKCYYTSIVKCTGTCKNQCTFVHVPSKSNLPWNIHILFNHVCKENVIFGLCLVELLSPKFMK